MENTLRIYALTAYDENSLIALFEADADEKHFEAAVDHASYKHDVTDEPEYVLKKLSEDGFHARILDCRVYNATEGGWR